MSELLLRPGGYVIIAVPLHHWRDVTDFAREAAGLLADGGDRDPKPDHS